MARSTKASVRWLAVSAVVVLFSAPAAAAPDPAPTPDPALVAACKAANAEPVVQYVCPRQSPWAPPAPDASCSTPQPNSWVPRCPLRTLPVLAAENKLAKAAMVVAFAEYPRLTNADYQLLTAQVDWSAKTQADCNSAKGQWDPRSRTCRVRPRVRVEPPTLAEDTCEWCCANHLDAIWKGQSVGSGAGCMVPSYVYHRGLLDDENLALDDGLLDIPARLRSYGFVEGDLPEPCLTDPLGCGKLDFGFPGWTLLLRKGSKPSGTGGLPNDGDRLELSLYNLMPPDEVRDDRCNPQNQPNPGDVYPDCFHGNDVTNVHFHGSHVSPQLHQDNVLVNVKPRGSVDRSGHDEVFFGRYDIALDPITWRQSEGTHWYHPHKHGSTALQVLNGMAGPLIIKGPFDDYIETQVFGAKTPYASSLAPQDKILVVQAIADELNLSARFERWNTPWAMVNGQFQPVIRMQPGEVQRWRLIGATQDSSAHVELSLRGRGLEVEQIAQDGVQLDPANYPQEDGADSADLWQLAPGNRIDLLVRASTDASVRGQQLTMMAQPNQNLPKIVLERRRIGDSSAVFPLFYVEICEPRPDNDCKVQDMRLPDDLPRLPDYLGKIQDSEIARWRTITFDQTADPAGAARDGAPAAKQVAKFRIDNTAYDPHCFNQTMQLGTAEEWRFVNNTVMNHPLHIHINPFQVTRMKYIRSLDPRPDGTYANRYEVVDRPYESALWKAPVWRDTIALPIVATPLCITPKGQAVPEIRDTQTCLDRGYLPPRNDKDGSWLPIGSAVPGEVILRQRFEDFTGPYVLHCHILGHEDRGMMQNLQTTCANGKYSRPANYFVDHNDGSFDPSGTRRAECSDSRYLDAGPKCTGMPPR